MHVRHLIPFFDPSVSQWDIRARLLRWLTFLWLFVGLVVLFSASYPHAQYNSTDIFAGLSYFLRQLFSVGLGLIIFNIVVHNPLRYVLKIAPLCVILLLGLIFVIFIPGVSEPAKGATRWISVGPLPIQPSELIKPFLVLQSARLFGQWHRFKWLLRLGWLLIFAFVLLGILLQPHLSTTVMCGITIWLIALSAGLPYIYLWGTALSGTILAVLSLRPYQKLRILSFLNPWADASGNGYQLVQSILAIGSGGTWGNGFGSSQQKLLYLPDHHTDFIFSVFAEEFGLAGSLLVLLLLIVYATLALTVAIKAQNAVHRLVAIGATILLVGQSLLNIGVATGSLPTTGITFPLVSYGGNSIIASLLAAGLLIRVARESSEAEIVSLN